MTEPQAPTIEGAQRAATWTLPGEAVFPEGIATDPDGTTFYVGSTADGTVYRGSVTEPGEAEVFLPPGTDGRTTVTGLWVDEQQRLFVAGRGSNRLFVYDTDDGDLLARLDPPPADRTLLNDVVVADNAAYVTDSFRPTLFRIPLDGPDIGPVEAWLDLAGTPIAYDDGFNLNGIVAADNGETLLTVHYGTGQLFRIDVADGQITEVDLGGEVLRTGDGMVLDGDLLHVVLGGPGEIATVRLDADRRAGAVIATTSRPEWRAPTTIAPAAGDRLLVVSSQLDMTGDGEEPTLPFTVTAVPTPSGGEDGADR